MAVLGSAPGIMVGIGVGTAAAAAIEPIVEPGRQEAWSAAPNRILAPALYAQLVAQGALDLKTVARPLAQREGLSGDQFDRLVYLAQRAPDLAVTLELWRRGLFGDPTSDSAQAFVRHALAKEQIETRYWPGILELFSERLAPALVATMVQRSILPNATDPVSGEQLLPGQPSTDGSNVPKMPQVDLDPIIEARAHGIDFPRLAAEARIVGLPASLDLAARMHFRDIITEGAYNQAVLEGNTRGEWAPFLLEGFREILTASQYAELELRGFYGRRERLLNTDKHGMSPADSDLLVDLQGRSIAVHQVTTGLARGGKYPGSYANVPEPYRAAIQRSNIRSEWSELAYANRYSYPSGFQIRGEAQAGHLTEAQTEELLLEVGWSPRWAKFFAQAWTATTTGAKADPYVGKAQSQLWTAIHKKFEKGEIDAATADSALTNLVTDAADRAYIMQLWETEQNLGNPAQPPA